MEESIDIHASIPPLDTGDSNGQSAIEVNETKLIYTS